MYLNLLHLNLKILLKLDMKTIIFAKKNLEGARMGFWNRIGGKKHFFPNYGKNDLFIYNSLKWFSITILYVH